ncbi:MAG: 2-phosphosulfolactate phosphatase [Dehalococcoidia bacterium]|nr:MAG: 2-phosphosulfolactate phosphatase [Dehalococcoidia bacterium]
MELDVIIAPTLYGEGELRDRLCAVVDVLRATSTITTALVSGASAVHPCLDIEEAKGGAAKMGDGQALLGGEERGKFIPGFDLGNSPLEYLSRETVEGKVIFFYTSNGTGAIRRTYEACGRPVYIAALNNISAVASAMVSAAADGKAEGMAVLCSGRYGKPSTEDLFCAGMVIDRVAVGLRDNGIITQMVDGASIAAGFAAANEGHSFEVLSSSVHGRYLKTIGYSDDLEYTSRLDIYDAVPVFDGQRIILSS